MEWHWWAALAIALVAIQIFAIVYVVHRYAKRDAETARQEELVRSTGEAATARVLEAQDTGTRFGAHRYVLVRLRLRVALAFGDPFETTIDARISPVRVPDFAEGREIAVRVAPDTRAVAIDQRVD